MARARWATRWGAAIVAAAALAPAGVRAQSPSGSASKSGKDADVPPAYRPPPGMCRVWLAAVPPDQQPAPTDCASAVRNRPSNGRVLFGDDYVGRKTSRVVRPAPTFWASGPNPGEPDATPVVAAAELISAAPRITAPSAAARPGQDEFEAGYAAGYRDAMNGRRPRFRGAGAAAATGAAPGYGTAYGATYPAAVPGESGGAVVVVPPGQDPRYFNNGRYAPPGRANGVCLDRDGDGWCDDPRFGAPVCRDLDGDGRCDDYPDLAASPYPSALPEMRAGLDVQQGRGSGTALRWLGTSEVVARVAGPQRRTGSPYRVLWFDANTNALLQTWTDLDGDGVADRVEVFRNGRRVKLLGR